MCSCPSVILNVCKPLFCLSISLSLLLLLLLVLSDRYHQSMLLLTLLSLFVCLLCSLIMLCDLCIRVMLNAACSLDIIIYVRLEKDSWSAALGKGRIFLSNVSARVYMQWLGGVLPAA